MPEARSALGRRFLALARRNPRAAALIGPDGEVLADRGTLASEAEALARSIPVEVAGGPVVVSLPNSPAMVRAFLGLRLAGVTVALADAAATDLELTAAAETLGAHALVTVPGRSGVGAVLASAADLAFSRADAGATDVPVGTAVLKLTSGSGGRPKAVAVSERQLIADSVQILRTMAIRPDDVTLAAIPLSHSYGLGSCLVPLLLVGTPLAFPVCALPAALATTLERARVAHFPAVPAMIRALGRLPDLPRLASMRVCLTAGAPLAPRDAAAFHAATGHKVHVFYGSSECGGITYDRSEHAVHDDGSVGTAMERVSVEVVDDDGRSVPCGVQGRVRVRSRAAALAVLPACEADGALGGGVFLTGDLGQLDPSGRLTLTGRVSETLNVAGKKVHPDEVRRAIESVPGVVNAAVTGLPDRHRGELVAALVAVEPGSGLTVPSLLRACRDRLAPHKVPRRVVLVDQLPLSERGKLRRDAVLELLRRVH
ncbi:MAG: class I adenylate-forming enzyme family protein [Acidobacteriota bacterium]